MSTMPTTSFIQKDNLSLIQVRDKEEKELCSQNSLGMFTDIAFSSTAASANLTFQELRLHSVHMHVCVCGKVLMMGVFHNLSPPC